MALWTIYLNKYFKVYFVGSFSTISLASRKVILSYETVWKCLSTSSLFCTRLALKGGAAMWTLKAPFCGGVHNILFSLCLSPLSDPVATVRDLRLDTLLQWNFGHASLRCIWISVANLSQASGSMFMKYEKVCRIVCSLPLHFFYDHEKKSWQPSILLA